MIKGTQIIYIPQHVEVIEGQEEMHPDVEPGFVLYVPVPGKSGLRSFVFCRYWSKHSPTELRTKANSELTPIDCLLIKNTRPQGVVDKAIEKIEKEKLNG